MNDAESWLLQRLEQAMGEAHQAAADRCERAPGAHRRRGCPPRDEQITTEQLLAAVGTGARCADVARSCGIAASSAYVRLRSLEADGLVWQDSRRWWHRAADGLCSAEDLERLRSCWAGAVCHEVQRSAERSCAPLATAARCSGALESWCAVCALQALLEVLDG